MSTTAVHRIELPIMFPHGLSAGESAAGNVLPIARNGRGEPVLRGSALAGALRHTWGRDADAPLTAERLFGAARGADDAIRARSRLELPDSVIDCGASGPIARTHNQINRHTGAALEGALYSIEALPPLARTTIVLWLFVDESLDVHGPQVAARLAGYFDNGLLLGGKSNRGLGMARLADTPRHRRYDLRDLDDHAAYLDDHRAWRTGSANPTGEPVEPNPPDANVLVVDFMLRVPRGQDMLVADHEAFDGKVVPQQVTTADGRTCVRLPGSSLRGAMRSWINRLAAREGRPVADSLPNYRKIRQEEGTYDGDTIGRTFLSREQINAGVRSECPVANLFGSFAAAGRLHISDALAEVPAQAIQQRMHVAVDRITGGACEGLLFSNQVVTAEPEARPAFPVRLLLRDPTDDEARWIADTLKAIDLGLIRIGSSKAGGRLALAERPTARGPQSEAFAFEVHA